MARFRTFDMGRAPRPDDEVGFELTGEHTKDPAQRWTESFRCVGLAPAGVLESLTQSITIEQQTGRRRYNSISCMEFVRAVLVDEDRERFDALLEDKDRIVGLIDLVSVVAWLSDELTLRPTQPSSGSGPGGGPLDGAATPVGAAT